MRRKPAGSRIQRPLTIASASDHGERRPLSDNQSLLDKLITDGAPCAQFYQINNYVRHR